MLLPMTATPKNPLPVVIVDTREQRPYQFSGPSIRAALKTGDYSIQGLESVAAVERKELSDLVGCVTFERSRFERELERASSFRRFWILIEGSLDQVERGQYRSKANPESILGSVAAWENRFNVRFVFAGNRLSGQRMTARLLAHAWKEFSSCSSRTSGEVIK